MTFWQSHTNVVATLSDLNADLVQTTASLWLVCEDYLRE